MRKLLLTLFLFTALNSNAQSAVHYKKVYGYDVFHKDWALVKTIAGTYGFINRDGKEIVPAIYVQIEKFNNKNLALVKNVANAYGFIDNNGKEVIKAIYFNKDEAIQKMNQYKN